MDAKEYADTVKRYRHMAALHGKAQLLEIRRDLVERVSKFPDPRASDPSAVARIDAIDEALYL